MRIRYVRIQSYRGLDDVAFPVGDNATLVGKNDAGKSSILEALGWFFRRDKAGLPREDAYTWHDSDDWEDGVFPDDEFSDADVFPDDARTGMWIEGKGAEDIRITLMLGDMGELGRLADLPRHRVPDAKTEDPLLVLQRRYSYGLLRPDEKFDPARCTSTLRVLVDWPDKWQDLETKDDYNYFLLPRFVMLEARAADYGEWLRQAIAPLAFQASLRTLTPESFAGLTAAMDALTETRQDLAEHVDQALSKAVADSATGRDDLPQVIPPAEFDWLGELESPPRIEIPPSLGDGTQRRLLLAALRLYENEELWPPDNSLVLAIEEPELFLHPQAQGSLAAAIQELRARGIQTFVSTHSATMVDRSNHDDVLVVQKLTNPVGTVIRSVKPLRGEREQFETILRVLGYRRSDLLLATRCAVLVEGKTDKEILEVWARTLGYDLGVMGVEILPGGGNENLALLSSSKLFGDFGVPSVVVLDGDLGDQRSKDLAAQFRSQGKVDGEDLFVWKSRCIESYFDLPTVEDFLKLPRRSIRQDQFMLNPVKAIGIALRPVRSSVTFDKTRDGPAIAREMPSERIHSDVRAMFERVVHIARGGADQ